MDIGKIEDLVQNYQTDHSLLDVQAIKNQKILEAKAMRHNMGNTTLSRHQKSRQVSKK